MTRIVPNDTIQCKGRIAITTQLKQTKNAFSFLGTLITESILQNKKLNEKDLLANNNGLTKFDDPQSGRIIHRQIMD